MRKAFIFDFDGTLIDSKKTIKYCFEKITQRYAPKRLVVAKKILIGPPLREAAKEILGDDHIDYLENFIQSFIDLHDEIMLIHTKPFPYVNNVLEELVREKNLLALATNKRMAPTFKLVEYFGWSSFFSIIECSDTAFKLRNKNELVKTIIKKDSRFKNSFLVGDTCNDSIAASKNNLKFIKAKYGYGDEQNWQTVKCEHSIKNFNEILNI